MFILDVATKNNINKEKTHNKDTNNTISSKNKNSKKSIDSRWTSHHRTDKHNFNHSWLFTNLKGHTGQVLDMDFSNNGKYLASCADGKFIL